MPFPLHQGSTQGTSRVPFEEVIESKESEEGEKHLNKQDLNVGNGEKGQFLIVFIGGEVGAGEGSGIAQVVEAR